MKELKIGCGKPTGASVGEPEKNEMQEEKTSQKEEVVMRQLRLGPRRLILSAGLSGGGIRTD